MSVFQTLLDMARQSDFTIGVRATGENKDQISLILAPAVKEGQEPALSQPVKLSGTVKELEEKFAVELNRVIGARASLSEQVDATLAILDAATKAQANKASSSLKAKGKPSLAPSAEDPDESGEPESLGQNSPVTAATSQQQAPNVGAGNLFADLT